MTCCGDAEVRWSPSSPMLPSMATSHRHEFKMQHCAAGSRGLAICCRAGEAHLFVHLAFDGGVLCQVEQQVGADVQQAVLLLAGQQQLAVLLGGSACGHPLGNCSAAASLLQARQILQASVIACPCKVLRNPELS